MTGVLDDYPGAMVGYSLRLLNTDYTGSAVTVRRASDNATQNIGFVDGELDVTALETFCSGTDGFVSVWFDQSGNGRNATQTTASAQPKIHDATTGVITSFGQPSIEFDGVADWMDVNYTSSRFSQLFVVKDNVDSAQSSVVSFSGSVQFQPAQYNTANNDITFSDFDGLYVVDNINVKGYLNDIDETNGATTFTQTFNRLILGSANGSAPFMFGFLSELIIYPFATDQSSNRVAIQDNINNFYTIY